MRHLAFALLICLIVPGCESSPEGTRQSVIESERDSFAFDRPRETVFAMVQELLGEKGFHLTGDLRMDENMETEWQPGGYDSQQQFVVRFIGLKKGRFTVHIVGLSRDRDGTIYSRLRWHDLEWELIQRASPDRALDIAARANDRADAVRRRNARRR